ncbi:hypothetical protein J5N97_024130 [Dioscorea zingiberensis]|uniref:ATP-dependent helicase ATRX n=1 Tax=Dioscorea zingiberensis TaxID=325984 RepID=A0A9D5C6P2_9LILI|nr:hypothetical protein J5N97_024130 [Dioscorea zingiberensis]
MVMDVAVEVEEVRERLVVLQNNADDIEMNSEGKELAELNKQNGTMKDIEPMDIKKEEVIADINQGKGEDVIADVNQGKGEDIGKKDLQSSEEDDGSDSDDMFIDESDGEHLPYPENDDEPNAELPLTEEEIEELVAEFLEVESKAAEAQESLEKETIEQVENEVRAELAVNLHGDELEKAVSTEMETFIEQWETVLDDLETQSALLLEQLDGAGIELPSLYKWIESQAPNGCCTEAWKKRAHWAGSQVTNELNQSVKDAEEYLQSIRPVRRQRGRLLEEGASGFLARKLAIEENKGDIKENSEKDWNSFNEIFQSHNCREGTSFGGKEWASVYLASTPKQAANMGLNLPGVDEVEEIDDIECNFNDPFYADAVANEKEIDLSEEQKKNFRKVKEEDDANVMRKLQRHLKQKRKRYSQVPKEDEGMMSLSDSSRPLTGKPSTSINGETSNEYCNAIVQNQNTGTTSNGIDNSGDSKRSRDNDNLEVETKRSRIEIIDVDDEVQLVENKSSHISHEQNGRLQYKEVVDIIDVDVLPSPNPKDPKFKEIKDSKNIHCTACSNLLKASEALKHPLLGVIVCGSCQAFVEEKMQIKESIPLATYCSWCGKDRDLIGCNSCKSLFCGICIARNLGVELLLKAKSGWKCCSCSPTLLDNLISECEEVIQGQKTSSSESGSEVSDAEIDIQLSHKKRRKRKIRRILDDTELGEETQEKIAIEKARQEHLKLMQEQSAVKSLNKNATSSNGVAIEEATVEMLGGASEGFIVNVAREEDEEPVRIPPSMSARLKPHQVAGIRFLWENIIQSVRKVKSGDKGLGCILAHTMGLGKTFQVIAFLYAAMRSIDLGLRTALVVTPVNVLHNWFQEFLKWRPSELKPLRVLMLEEVARERRAHFLEKWRAKGGVLLIGYAAFRNLSLGRHVKDRNIATQIFQALHYGPDILVCDEAHMIKNTKADITQALKQVKTQRRIALTGSPLQNNLMEYYCMVDFVREGFLGSSHEFRNRFQNPIENGQHTNSTSDDVKIMNQRSHILYEQLKGFVQRMGMTVVKKDLPPKTVFVITVKLSPLQRSLYKKFLDVHGFTGDKGSSDRTFKRSCFFAGYQALAQIWNHPGLLRMAKEHKDNLRREDAVENFLMDDGSSDDNLENGDLLTAERQRARSELMPKKHDNIFDNEETDWWQDLLDEKIYKEVDFSGKMVLLLDILSMSSDVGDKALVFSQSLATLDLIELYLSKFPRRGCEGKFWKQGKDWYRLDGRSAGSERQKLVERFNDPGNRRVKCTLISTRAGSLGINLQAANRVIVVDGSWNPTNDLQAIFRVWRFGQNKPVFAYRLLAHGTMEEKIYKRQVTKEGLAARVVDRQQIHRTMSKEEMLHLFDFGDDENNEMLEERQENPAPSNQESSCEAGCLPVQKSLPPQSASSDKFMESIVSRHYPRWIANYHEHESLLQENEAERLSKEEQDMAWQNFQQSLEWEEVRRVTYDDPSPPERKVNASIPSESNASQQSKGSSRNRSAHQRKCTNLAHLLTLRSRGTKSGSTTVCGECSQEISWENLNRDGKSRYFPLIAIFSITDLGLGGELWSIKVISDTKSFLIINQKLQRKIAVQIQLIDDRHERNHVHWHRPSYSAQRMGRDLIYRHSNCLDRFKKLRLNETENSSQNSSSSIENSDSERLGLRHNHSESLESFTGALTRRTQVDIHEGSSSEENNNGLAAGLSEALEESHNQESGIASEVQGEESMDPADSGEGSPVKPNCLKCPLCRGSVMGWMIVKDAREYLDLKTRSCSRESCPFSGNYRELRRHARRVHPSTRPSDVDPSRQRAWRRLEHQREYGDILSAIRSAMPGAIVLGDYVIDSADGLSRERGNNGSGEGGGGPWWTTFFLFHMISGPAGSHEEPRGSSRAWRTHRRRNLWGENLLGLQDDVAVGEKNIPIMLVLLGLLQ